MQKARSETDSDTAVLRLRIIMANPSRPARLYLSPSAHWHNFFYSNLHPWNLNTVLFDQANDFIKSIVFVNKTWAGDATRKRANIIVDLRYFPRPGVRFKGGYDTFFRYLDCRQSVHNYCEVHDVCHDAGNVMRAAYIKLEKYILTKTGTRTCFGRHQKATSQPRKLIQQLG